MILLDNFYTIDSLNHQENEIIANITLDKNHSIFDGHFPDNPVTPGVVQLEIIKEILSRHYQRKMNMISLSNCKFLAILNPIEHPKVELKLSFKEEDGSVKVSGTISHADSQFLKVAAVYQ